MRTNNDDYAASISRSDEYLEWEESIAFRVWWHHERIGSGAANVALGAGRLIADFDSGARLFSELHGSACVVADGERVALDQGASALVSADLMRILVPDWEALGQYGVTKSSRGEHRVGGARVYVENDGSISMLWADGGFIVVNRNGFDLDIRDLTAPVRSFPEVRRRVGQAVVRISNGRDTIEALHFYQLGLFEYVSGPHPFESESDATEWARARGPLVIQAVGDE